MTKEPSVDPGLNTGRSVAHASASASLRSVTLGTADYEKTIELRRAVLLDPFGIPLEKACADDGQALHLALFDETDEKTAEGGRALGCLLLIDRGGGTWQLRQMAILPELQRMGLGRRLVEAAWERAREAGCTQLMAHAREPAVPFYLSAGFSAVGEAFEQVGLPHRLVVRRTP